MADKHEIDGVRKEKERLTAAQRLVLASKKFLIDEMRLVSGNG